MEGNGGLYRVFVSGKVYERIDFPYQYFLLSKTNKRRERCMQCCTWLQKSEGVFHQKRYKPEGLTKGFWCADCAKKFIAAMGPTGYTENYKGQLKSNPYVTGKHALIEVLAGFRKMEIIVEEK